MKAPRLISSGDSFTFGEGLNDRGTLPNYFSKVNNKYKVKNWGFHGWGVNQAFNLFESMKPKNRGEVNFLLTAPWQAQRSSCIPFYTVDSPKYVIWNEKLVRDGLCRRPKVIENLPDFIRGPIYASNLFETFTTALGNYDLNGQYETYYQIIKEFDRLSKSRHTRFVVGYIRADENSFEESKYDNEVFIDKLRKNSIEVIGLNLAPKSELIQPQFMITSDGHPTAKANAMRAILLNKYLLSNPKSFIKID